MNFPDAFTLHHSSIGLVRVEPPDIVVVERPDAEMLRFSRTRLQACEPMRVDCYRQNHAPAFVGRDDDVVVRLRIDEMPIDLLGPFPCKEGAALGGAIRRARRDILFATPEFALAIAEDGADLVIERECSPSAFRVGATRLVAITPSEHPDVEEANRVIASGLTGRWWLTFAFMGDRPRLLGPFAHKDAAAIALGFRGWRSQHPIDAEPIDVTQPELTAYPYRWHLRRIRVTGTWQCGFEMNHFANAWLVAPEGGHPGTGTYQVRAVGTWVYPPNVPYPQYGGMGGSPGELRAESVEIIAVSECGPGTNRDGLTGLFNRREIVTTFAQVCTAPVARGEPVSFALLDLDHFKRFNDANGHLAGDELLRSCADVILAAVRPGDVVGRWGGEEFAVVMPSAGLEIARDIIGRVLDAIRALKITCSAGVTEVRSGESLAEVAQRADLALYDAKRAGRDRLATAPLA